jgi:hypothetical protein
MPKAKNRIVGIKVVSAAGFKKALDSRAKRVLGVSGDEFIRRYSSGNLGSKSLDRKPGTLALATLCSFTKGHSASKKQKRRS